MTDFRRSFDPLKNKNREREREKKGLEMSLGGSVFRAAGERERESKENLQGPRERGDRDSETEKSMHTEYWILCRAQGFIFLFS